ncbi:dynein regulatory complex subunit 4-like isoform X2 [Cyprinodon tularosa]|uniref:dynein regulatory complex subunit 4-like isoform X2 n=1 Tax=Cyprinodon tularosa TaxID=77115 RepID=UPI0018E24D83|nr:dynein regulatory complex subunit 4-like isoform X2 [Cyprinodon tularosa]
MPPKKKETNKPETARNQTLINGLTKEELSKEQMEEHIMRLCKELEREREERNYFQLERDMVQSSLDVTNKKLEKVKAELKTMDKAIEDDEASHQVEIKVFKQKMKHLLCEHQNTISELGAERIALAEVLQNEQDQLEEELYKEMKNILVDMRTSKNEEVVRELQLKHEKEMAAVKEKWERLLADTARKSNADIKQLQQELDIKRKSEIFAQKLQLGRYINELKEDQKRALNDARDFFLKRDNSSKITDLEEQHFKMTCQLKQMKEELPTLSKENEELTGLVAEAKGELNRLETRAKFLPMAKGPISIPQKKEVKELRKYCDELQEKFNQLYMEVDEMRSSFPQKILIAEEKADRSLRPLEDELQAAKERLEKIQVQPNLVPSAPNLDQIAVAEITDKEKVGSGMWQRPGANKGGFCN